MDRSTLHISLECGNEAVSLFLIVNKIGHMKEAYKSKWVPTYQPEQYEMLRSYRRMFSLSTRMVPNQKSVIDLTLGMGLYELQVKYAYGEQGYFSTLNDYNSESVRFPIKLSESYNRIDAYAYIRLIKGYKPVISFSRG